MRVFISYSHADRRFVRALARALERFDVEVWLDDHHLRIGEVLSQRLAEAIHAADFVVLVISPSSIASDWVRHEVRLTLDREQSEGGRTRLLPLLLHGAHLPAGLEGRLFADFRESGSMAKEFPRLLLSLGITRHEIAAKGFESGHREVVRADSMGFFLDSPAWAMSTMDYFGNSELVATGLDHAPYVVIGQYVTPETLLARIGASFGGGELAVFPGCAGVVERILAEPLQPVEYGQPLFVIRKSAGGRAGGHERGM